MASSSFHVFLFCALLCISSSLAQTSFRPKALVLPVWKDASTLQYITHLNQRTPLVAVNLTLDLGGESYELTVKAMTMSPPPSAPPVAAPLCATLLLHCLCNCHQHLRPLSRKYRHPHLHNRRPWFRCRLQEPRTRGLANGVQGMAGLGRSRISLPSQFSASFSFPRKFAERKRGCILRGRTIRAITRCRCIESSYLHSTFYQPRSWRVASSDYFIGVKSVKVNGKIVPINAKLLSINNTDGYGGTKISTVNPYTVLETSIYNAVVEAFVNELNATRVASVAPFGACFSSKGIVSTRGGPAVPPIDLVLQNENVYWRMFGANSMVYISDEVLCLGFVDGGVNPRTSIVIGGHQIEDILLQFDLASSRLGFTSSLLFSQTTCANFNFTANV
ncbi:hypothetical protein RJ639_004086 [Escallonia herrerae]|uniref:Peptidase A1 domain-containing protein n=1 Tax=Escallonia herrerae TaxID=1293975 RepID=A0AA88W2A1_9ASTE|nr:hypothetical protein RJ639_004086 [Escallonia herrerae]